MNLRRLSLALAAAAVVAAVAVVPAAAKEDVKATLLSTIPTEARPGAKLDVSWKLFSIGAHGRHVPFEAGSVFVRLSSASGSQTEEAFAQPVAPGFYRAKVTVPKSGIGGVEIGLEGWTNGPSGTHRSDLIFPVTNRPALDVTRVTVRDRGRNWAAIVTMAVLGTTVIALLVLRRRGRFRQSLERSGSSPSR
jgi:hypothetical protein